jgi:flagellar biosynthesis repressor protein FlbT
MALKVELKPSERFILGTAVITNGSQRARLYIEGDISILREKDILTPETADSPAKRIYLAVQMIYLAGESQERRDIYFELVNDIVKAAPSTLPFIDRINNQILTGHLYKAMREAKKLIDYEEDLLENAKHGSAAVRQHSTEDEQPA